MKEEKDVQKDNRQEDSKLDESDYLKEEFTIWVPKKSSSEAKKLKTELR